MLYDLEQGPVASDVIAIAEKTGRLIPDEIVNRPELLPGLSLYYGAFIDLQSCRPQGFGAAAIPYTAIVMWMDEADVQGSQRKRGIYLLKTMDTVYLDWAEAKRKRDELARERKSKKR